MISTIERGMGLYHQNHNGMFEYYALTELEEMAGLFTTAKSTRRRPYSRSGG